MRDNKTAEVIVGPTITASNMSLRERFQQREQRELSNVRVVTNSLIPAFQRIQEELEDLHSSGHWMILVLIFLSLWTAAGNLYFVWRLRRATKKRSEIRAGPPV